MAIGKNMITRPDPGAGMERLLSLILARSRK